MRNGEGQFGQVIWFGRSAFRSPVTFLLARGFSNRHRSTTFSRFRSGGPNFGAVLERRKDSCGGVGCLGGRYGDRPLAGKPIVSASKRFVESAAKRRL